MNWATICLGKRTGCLGVKILRGLNKALLAKWSWNFTVKRGAFWSEVLRGKYGEKEGDGALGRWVWFGGLEGN